MQLRHLGIGRGRGKPVPASRRTPALRDSDPAAVLRRHPARRGRAVGAVATEHFRRPADRAAAHRRHRGPRHRPPIAAGARILADEAVRRRSRDPQRARGVPMCRTFRSRSRRWCGTSQSRPQFGVEGPRGPRLRAASRSDLDGDTRPSRVGGAGRAGGTARAPVRSARSRSRIAELRVRPLREADRRSLPSRRPRRLCRTSNSSTGSAASRRTAGNM